MYVSAATMERAVSAWCRRHHHHDTGCPAALMHFLLHAWRAALKEPWPAAAPAAAASAPPPAVLQHIEEPMKTAALAAWAAGQTVLECDDLFVAFASSPPATAEEYARAFRAMRAWLSIARSLAAAPGASTCAQQHRQLRVYMIWTPLRKQRAPTDPRGAEQANGGFSFRCARPEIVVFRREEWWKVFLHETLHSFGLDCGTSAEEGDDVRRLFHGGDAAALTRRRPMLLLEAFTECWARLWLLAWAAVVRGRRGGRTAQQAAFRALLLESQLFAAAQAERWVAPHTVQSILARPVEGAAAASAAAASPTDAPPAYQEQTEGLMYHVAAAALLCDLPALYAWSLDRRCLGGGAASSCALAPLLAGALGARAAARVREEVARAPPPPVVPEHSMRMTHLDCSPELVGDIIAASAAAVGGRGGRRTATARVAPGCRFRRVARPKTRSRRPGSGAKKGAKKGAAATK